MHTGRRVFHGLTPLDSPHTKCNSAWFVARRRSTLASFYKYCEEDGLVKRNPALNVRRPKFRTDA
jgi:site-specific recombinase XerD